MRATDVLAGIRGHIGARPDHPAVKDLDRELSYGQLGQEAEAIAAGLRARQVVAGDRVALHLPNSVDFVTAALGCLWIGATFVPLAVSDPEARLEVIVGDCGPTVIVTSDPTDDSGDGFPVSSPALRTFHWVSITELRDTSTDLVAPVEVTQSVAYAIYTSGTTGTPKGVLIGNRAFVAAVEATSDALGLGPDTRTLCVSPFHFDGSFGTLFPTLYSGGSIVIRPREALLFPRTFFNAIKREGITYTGFSPSYLRLLLSSPQMEQLAETALEVVALGGEASSGTDIRSFWDAAPDVRIFNRYGPTETTIAVTHLEVTPEMVAGGTVPIGRPHPAVTFYVVDEVGQVVDEDKRVGELYIGGDQLMDGYWGAPQLTADVLRHDVVPDQTVYRTGDLVYRDETGAYVYVDRVDRVIKRQGIRISLVELGEAMRSLAGVSAAACVAFDNEGDLGIVAFVVTEAPMAAIDLRRAAAEVLPDSMLPNRYELVDALPLTKSSKLDERLLLAEVGLAVPSATRGP